MNTTFDERLAAMEKDIAAIKSQLARGNRKDWRRTLGMFGDDELMKQIDAEALKYRQADRRKAHRGSGSKKKSAK